MILHLIEWCVLFYLSCGVVFVWLAWPRADNASTGKVVKLLFLWPGLLFGWVPR